MTKKKKKGSAMKQEVWGGGGEVHFTTFFPLETKKCCKSYGIP